MVGRGGDLVISCSSSQYKSIVLSTELNIVLSVLQ